MIRTDIPAAEFRSPQLQGRGGAPLVADEAISGDRALAVMVGRNLHQLRLKKKFSLERLAQLSGVSRAMLGQIELGRSVPTIKTLCKIAAAFDVAVSAFLDQAVTPAPELLPEQEARWLESSRGQVRSRALFPSRSEGHSEFYEMRIAPGAAEVSGPHATGTLENLVVASGEIEVTVDKGKFPLSAGDAMHFIADVNHGYRNVGAIEAALYVVLSYSPARASR